MSFNPKRRYSAVAVMSEDLDRVVLIHKLRPDWQAGKANLPGGKVDKVDYPADAKGFGEFVLAAHLACAARELREETGLDVAVAAYRRYYTAEKMILRGKPVTWTRRERPVWLLEKA